MTQEQFARYVDKQVDQKMQVFSQQTLPIQLLTLSGVAEQVQQMIVADLDNDDPDPRKHPKEYIIMAALFSRMREYLVSEECDKIETKIPSSDNPEDFKDSSDSNMMVLNLNLSPEDTAKKARKEMESDYPDFVNKLKFYLPALKALQDLPSALSTEFTEKSEIPENDQKPDLDPEDVSTACWVTRTILTSVLINHLYEENNMTFRLSEAPGEIVGKSFSANVPNS